MKIINLPYKPNAVDELHAAFQAQLPDIYDSYDSSDAGIVIRLKDHATDQDEQTAIAIVENHMPSQAYLDEQERINQMLRAETFDILQKTGNDPAKIADELRKRQGKDNTQN